MKHTFNILLLLTVILQSNGLAKNGGALPLAKPESVGMSSERLERIDKVLRDHVKKVEILRKTVVT